MGTVKRALTWAAFLFVLIASVGSITYDEDGQPTTETREEKMIRYRLPNNTIPRVYKISIEPNMESENLTWIGETTIDIEVLQPTSVLTLHAYKNLVFDENSTALIDAYNTKHMPIEQIRDEEVEFVKVKFDHEIPVGNYSLNFKYEGDNYGSRVGFYDASIAAPKIAGTHFEATTARRAFPCWDEPGFKARFRLSIVHFPNYTAVSNMPEIERVPTANGKILTTFDTTPIMPTYLLNFVIAEYESVSNEHGNVTIWARKDLLEEVKHVVDLSPKIVDVMEKYTGFSYGFPRIGSVLLPVYSASATEHWGLVTYFESIMKLNQTHDMYDREDLANVLMAHELAHSWFGNRVSPLWWDDLWLNEAFAAYFQYYIMDEIFDNWGGDQLFILRNNQQMSFIIDDHDAIPIRWTPVTNLEIRRLFGPITYRKGSSIVHMFRNVLTDDVFRAGIQKFLGKHSFGAADADDLMEAFQEAYDESSHSEAPLNVKETMSSWLLQSGHPIVNVTRNYTTGITTVSQQSNLVGRNSSNKWWIPLSYTTQSNINFSSTAPTRWINDTEDSVTISDIDKNDWVIFNVRATGFYRVNYDDENWNRITDYLNTDNYNNIHVLNRAQLINDVFYMVNREPERHFEKIHKLIKYLSREVDYLPWRAAKNTGILNGDVLLGTELHKTFQKYVFGLMSRLIEKVGFEQRDNDDHLTILSRGEFVEWACLSGHSGCSDFAVKKLLKVMENGTTDRLHRNTKILMACAGLRGFNDTTAKRFVTWALENERKLLVSSLGCTENHEIQRDFLNAALTKNFTVSPEEFASAFRFITAGSEENYNFASDFFLQNHRAVKNLVNPNKRPYERTPLYEAVGKLGDEVTTPSRLEKYKQILQLDSVVEIEDFDRNRYLEFLEKHVSQNNELVVKFNDQWHEELAAENTIKNTLPESR